MCVRGCVYTSLISKSKCKQWVLAKYETGCLQKEPHTGPISSPEVAHRQKKIVQSVPQLGRTFILLCEQLKAVKFDFEEETFPDVNS